MKRNSTYDHLRLLTDEEIRRLGKFLRSPYFNYSQPVIILFDTLRKYHPEYDTGRIMPEVIWKKIFPGKPFSEKKYWATNFNLRSLIAKFMAVEKVQVDEQLFKKLLIKSYADRNAHSLFEKGTQNLIEQINNYPWQDIHTYSESLWLKHDYFYDPSTDKFGGAKYSIEDAMEELDRFYCLAKLRFATEIKNREKIFSKKNKIRFLEEVVKISEKYEEENPAFLMYKNVIELYDPKKAEAAYSTGKRLLENKFELLSRHDQNEILLNLRNYAIRQLNNGKKKIWKEVFELYKIGLKLDLVLDNNKISVSAFGNIVKAGCVVGEFNWVEKFISDFEPYLQDHLRLDAKTISNGTLYFHKKEYAKTVDVLSQHHFTELLYQLDGRILLIKAWFHQFLENHELYSFINSTLAADEKYFRRNDVVSEQRKLIHLNFILAVKKLSELIFSKTDREIIKEKMNIHLQKEKPIVSMAWLREIIEEL